jgi:hypothetical protein
MSDYTTQDAVEFALDKDVSSFKNAVADILQDKIHAAIDAKKSEVAATILQPEEDYTEDQEGQGEEDGSDEI